MGRVGRTGTGLETSGFVCFAGRVVNYIHKFTNLRNKAVPFHDPLEIPQFDPALFSYR